MDSLIFVLAGIIVLIMMMCFSELLVWIWGKLDPPAKVEEVRTNADYRYNR